MDAKELAERLRRENEKLSSPDKTLDRFKKKLDQKQTELNKINREFRPA